MASGVVEHEAPSRSARAVLIALVACAAVSTDLYLSGIPSLAADLGVGPAEAQLTLSVFMAAFAVGQLVFGPLSDHYGRKPVAAIGLSLYSVAALACMLAPGIGLLLVARCVQGFAASSGPVIARAIVRDRFQGAEAARFMSQLAGAMAVVPLLAPVLGSWLLYWFDWRAQFGMLLLFGLLTLLGLRSLRETCPSIGIAPLAFGRVIAQFGSCLSQRRFVGFVLCGGSAFAAAFTWISSASWIVIDLLGVPATHFGYTFMLVVTGYMGGSFASARIVPRIGVQRTLLFGVCAALGGALILLLQGVWLGPSLGGVLVGVFCSFLGGGLCLPNSQMGAISEFPMSAGGASAVFGFVQTAMASGFGWLAGHTYDGSLLPTSIIMTAGALCAVTGYLLLYAGRGGNVHG